MNVETLAEGHFLKLIRDGRWEYVERTRASGIVIIVPVTEEGKLLLIEQYRPPVRSDCIEFPAGLAGDLADSSDESPAAAARRELREETGFETHELRLLGTACPSAGLTSEVMTFFEARGLRQVSAGGGVENEDITIHQVSLGAVRAWLEEQSERASVAMMVYTGLFLANC